MDGCFYWYDNNWHYLRKWEHLQNMKTAGKLPVQVYANRPDYSRIEVPRSDAIMARTICMQIKLGWSPEQIEQRIAKIKEILS